MNVLFLSIHFGTKSLVRIGQGPVGTHYSDGEARRDSTKRRGPVGPVGTHYSDGEARRDSTKRRGPVGPVGTHSFIWVRETPNQPEAFIN